jgi:hypothetical protein
MVDRSMHQSGYVLPSPVHSPLPVDNPGGRARRDGTLASCLFIPFVRFRLLPRRRHVPRSRRPTRRRCSAASAGTSVSSTDVWSWRWSACPGRTSIGRPGSTPSVRPDPRGTHHSVTSSSRAHVRPNLRRWRCPSSTRTPCSSRRSPRSLPTRLTIRRPTASRWSTAGAGASCGCPRTRCGSACSPPRPVGTGSRSPRCSS